MKGKILIVEDDIVLSKMYKKKFELSDYEVLLAMNGEQGLEMAINKHPDVIILDIMMPQVDGIKMMDQLRMDPWGKVVPILILTNLDPNDDVIKRVVVDQPSYYILKSNTVPEEVVEKVASLMPHN